MLPVYTGPSPILPTGDLIPTPTPITYICPSVDKKTLMDDEEEKAENELSSYIRYENTDYSNPPDPNPTQQKIVTTILEKKSLPCALTESGRCTLSNITIQNDKWSFTYPKSWNLYLIKRKVQSYYGNANKPDHDDLFYDLKFENGGSYFYLRESLTLGGQPIMITMNQWEETKKHCNSFLSTPNTYKQMYSCEGNSVDCLSYQEDHRRKFVPINTYYRQLFSADIEQGHSLSGYMSIYEWYLPSLDFDRDPYIGALRIYTLSNNFHSTDPTFIKEVENMYIQLFGKR